MRRANWSWAIALAMAAGCGPAPSFVYVDENLAIQALLPAEPEPMATVNIPRPPASVAAEGLDVPGSPPRSIGFTDFEDRSALVRDTIEVNRRDAIRVLTSRLRDAYYLEIKRLEAESRLALRGDRSADYDFAIQEILALFERWANRRAPFVFGIALTAGFPDPDPGSGRTLDPDASRMQRYDFERAQQYRAALQAVDAEYREERDQILAKVESGYADRLRALAAATAAAFADADERAAREARAQIPDDGAGGDVQLVSAAVDRPAESPLTVDVPPVSFPRVDSAPLESADGPRRDVARWIQVWAATNGYKPTTDPHKGRNATDEFIAWVKRRQSGP